jgi:hypothetical protein
MKPNAKETTDAKSLLLSMVAEAQNLKQAAGGSVTDAVAGWLAGPAISPRRPEKTGIIG